MFRTQDDDDPFIKGEFDVIKELLDKIPEAKEGKRKVSFSDHNTDLKYKRLPRNNDPIC